MEEHKIVLISFALVVVGVLFLLRNVGILPPAAWDVVWPLVLIVLGIAVFLNRGDASFSPWSHSERLDRKRSRG